VHCMVQKLSYRRREKVESSVATGEESEAIDRNECSLAAGFQEDEWGKWLYL